MTNKHFKDRSERIAFGRGLPAAIICESVQGLVQIPKDWPLKTHPVQVWPDSQGNDREAEWDTG